MGARRGAKNSSQQKKLVTEWYTEIRASTARMGSCGLDSSGSGQGPVAGCYEHGNEP